MRFVLLLLLAACAAAPSDDWPVSTLEAEGIDPAAVDAFVLEVERGSFGHVDHLTIVRRGRLVFDRHFPRDYAAIAAPYDPEPHPYDYDHPDFHPYYRGTNLHTLQSVTKSITALCIGIAIDEGAIPGGVATPAMSWFGAYEPDLDDAWRRAMTLEDLLTMRSGIAWNEMISYDDPANSCLQLEDSDDWVQYVIDQPMREAPGTVFDYNSGVSVLLGKIVREATGVRIDEYARTRLFEPLGITDFHWKVTPRGEIDTEGGLYLAAPDLARIAEMVRLGGTWRGERVVSQAWIDACVRPVVADIDPASDWNDQGYGYQWWVPIHEDGQPLLYQGSGYGGQFPIVDPARELVVVLNAWNTHETPPRSAWMGFFEGIRPAVGDPALRNSAVEDQALAD